MWILDILLTNWNLRECDTALMALAFLICKLEIPAVNFCKVYFISGLRLLPYITVDSYFLRIPPPQNFFYNYTTTQVIHILNEFGSLCLWICPFLLNCQLYWDKVVHNIPLLFKIIFSVFSIEWKSLLKFYSALQFSKFHTHNFI